MRRAAHPREAGTAHRAFSPRPLGRRHTPREQTGPIEGHLKSIVKALITVVQEVRLVTMDNFRLVAHIEVSSEHLYGWPSMYAATRTQVSATWVCMTWWVTSNVVHHQRVAHPTQPSEQIASHENV